MGKWWVAIEESQFGPLTATLPPGIAQQGEGNHAPIPGVHHLNLHLWPEPGLWILKTALCQRL